MKERSMYTSNLATNLSRLQDELEPLINRYKITSNQSIIIMNITIININNALLITPYQLNIWFGLFLWITGNIGCIGNMIVFHSKSFRHRAYSIYLFSEAMSDFIYFNFVLITRILQKGFQISITNQYDIICKLRQFVSIWGNQISFTLFSFATIDRLLSAQRSNIYRQWSNRISLAYKLLIICLIFWLLLTGHRFIFYSIKNNICTPLEGFYADYDNYFEVIFTAICPPITVAILGYLLMRSIRYTIQRRITPINSIPQIVNIRRSVLQQVDSQLTLMLILQSIIAIITYIPYAAELIYTNISQQWPKSPLQNIQEKIFIELTHLLSYVFFASSFYVSIISNSGFRRQIKYLFQKQKQRLSIDVIHNIFHNHAIGTVQQK